MGAAVSIDQAADKRRRDLAAIHASAKQLQLDRDAYVAVLQRIAGKASSADLTAKERKEVLDEMRRLGAGKPRVRTPRGLTRPGHYPGAPEGGSAMLDKIEAQLADMKLSWRYADAIARRMFGIQCVAWVRKEEQLKGIIAALDVEHHKRSLNAYIDQGLRTLGIAEENLVTLLRPLRPNWRRHLPSLKLVAKFIEFRKEAAAAQAGAHEVPA